MSQRAVDGLAWILVFDGTPFQQHDVCHEFQAVGVGCEFGVNVDWAHVRNDGEITDNNNRSGAMLALYEALPLSLHAATN